MTARDARVLLLAVNVSYIKQGVPKDWNCDVVRYAVTHINREKQTGSHGRENHATHTVRVHTAADLTCVEKEEDLLFPCSVPNRTPTVRTGGERWQWS